MREFVKRFPEFTITAGPLEVEDRVRDAIGLQVIYHLDDLFFDIYRETTDLAKKVFQTKNDIIIMHAEAVLGLQAAAACSIEPGDKCLNLATGPFGKGYGHYIKAYEGELIEIETPFNESVDPTDVRKAFEKNKDIKFLSVVHCETPAGTWNDVKNICRIAKEYGAITMVDAVSSVGGTDMRPEDWGVDICVVGPQKCIGSMPGLSVISVSEDAWKKMEGLSNPVRGSFLSMLDWKEKWLGDGRFPYTPSVNQIYGLNEALNIILEEGLENVFARHDMAAKACRAGVWAMGLQVWAAREEFAANSVTSIKTPDGIDDADLRHLMRDKYSVQISGGHGPLVGKLFRIGHMGKVARVQYVLVALSALEMALKDLGFKVDPGAGVAAALKAIDD